MGEGVLGPRRPRRRAVAVSLSFFFLAFRFSSSSSLSVSDVPLLLWPDILVFSARLEREPIESKSTSKLTGKLCNKKTQPSLPSKKQPLRRLRALARRADVQRQALDAGPRRAPGLHGQGGRSGQGRRLQDPSRLRRRGVLVLRLSCCFRRLFFHEKKRESFVLREEGLQRMRSRTRHFLLLFHLPLITKI